MNAEKMMLEQTRDYVEGVLSLVDSGQIAEADGYAIVAADVLAESCLAHHHGMVESAAVLAETASRYAMKRRALAVASAVAIPDDLSSLDQESSDD